jgi:hypothetical protein
MEMIGLLWWITGSTSWEIHIAEHLECAQISEDDCFLAICECGTLITVACKS